MIIDIFYFILTLCLLFSTIFFANLINLLPFVLLTWMFSFFFFFFFLWFWGLNSGPCACLANCYIAGATPQPSTLLSLYLFHQLIPLIVFFFCAIIFHLDELLFPPGTLFSFLLFQVSGIYLGRPACVSYSPFLPTAQQFLSVCSLVFS
jgi:hypothetical protein